MLDLGITRSAGRVAALKRGKSASSILTECRQSSATKFDVFLCHSSKDAELIFGAKLTLEELGLTVYVDWLDDRELDRAAVDRDTAHRLRIRMQQSENLFYAHTANSSASKWCPWELGYFDAKSHPGKKVFVLPIGDGAANLRGQEYLALYDPVDLSAFDHRRRRMMRRDLYDIYGAPRAFRGSIF